MLKAIFFVKNDKYNITTYINTTIHYTINYQINRIKLNLNYSSLIK
jgi:hypothetical protein